MGERLSAAERGETAVIVTSCGCYLTGGFVEVYEGTSLVAGEPVEHNSRAFATSKDPQKAMLFDSARDARLWMRGGWFRAPVQPDLICAEEVDDCCDRCGAQDVQIGVLTAPPLIDTQLVLALDAPGERP